MDFPADAFALVVAWCVGPAAAGVLVLRAVRPGADRGTWLPLAAAALLLSLADAGRRETGAVGAWWSLALDLTGLALLCAVQLRSLHRRIDSHVPSGVLDTLNGTAMGFMVVGAVALTPLEQVPGVGTAESVLVLATLSGGLLALALTASAALLSGDGREPRAWCLIGATALALLADAVTVAAVVVQGIDARPRAFGVVVHAVPPLLLALAALTPAPAPRARRDETTAGLLLAPLAALVTAGTVLGWSHADPRPTPVVVAALLCMVLVTLKVAVVFRRTTALNLTRRQALTDELTGVGNRRALSGHLAAVDAGAPAALALVDLDRFKEVNDVLGHAAGDELLRQVAGRLAADAAPGELVARQGGDEFALLLPGAPAAQAAERAALLVHRLAEPFDLGGRRVRVAASVGVAAAPEHARGAEELLRSADGAMYRAKAGGGGVVVHDPLADEQRREQQALVDDLRAAVAGDGLGVHFQPQLDAATGELVGVEALVRWEHPTRGLLGPADFLGLVEEHGMMAALTEQVLRKALARAAGAAGADDAGGRRVRTSVNVSAACLRNPELVPGVAALLLEHGVAPGDLLLEITETALMADPAVSRRVVHALVDLGVGVSIDDYGTGHSSLAYLRDLPAAELKLDRSFTAVLTADPRTGDIVRTTVDLAHSLGLRMVAEGVEDEATLQRLRELGVDVTQGFHHARPLDAASLAAWVREHRGAGHGAR